jgi:hypothetical protein
MKLRLTSLIALVSLAAKPYGFPAVAQGIADNSFLMEEAYNQEPRVVQHISAWQRSLRSAAWAFSFTQEWPVGSQTHQLSYTILLARTDGPSHTGFGDLALNYRYQLQDDDHVAIAPRLSLLVPTGSAPRRLGTGHVGAQLNVPMSLSLGPSFVTHWNAGVTAFSDLTIYNAGASAIWLARPMFNVMVETVWLRETGGQEALVVNPGIRWAHNFASGLQIVPGIAFPYGVGSSAGARGVFLYLSFEHRFGSKNKAN